MNLKQQQFVIDPIEFDRVDFTSIENMTKKHLVSAKQMTPIRNLASVNSLPQTKKSIQRAE